MFVEVGSIVWDTQVHKIVGEALGGGATIAHSHAKLIALELGMAQHIDGLSCLHLVFKNASYDWRLVCRHLFAPFYTRAIVRRKPGCSPSSVKLASLNRRMSGTVRSATICTKKYHSVEFSF